MTFTDASILLGGFISTSLDTIPTWFDNTLLSMNSFLKSNSLYEPLSNLIAAAIAFGAVILSNKSSMQQVRESIKAQNSDLHIQLQQQGEALNEQIKSQFKLLNVELENQKKLDIEKERKSKVEQIFKAYSDYFDSIDYAVAQYTDDGQGRKGTKEELLTLTDDCFVRVLKASKLRVKAEVLVKLYLPEVKGLLGDISECEIHLNTLIMREKLSLSAKKPDRETYMDPSAIIECLQNLDSSYQEVEDKLIDIVNEINDIGMQE